MVAEAIQLRELRLQQEELRLTREEMARQRVIAQKRLDLDFATIQPVFSFAGSSKKEDGSYLLKFHNKGEVAQDVWVESALPDHLVRRGVASTLGQKDTPFGVVVDYAGVSAPLPSEVRLVIHFKYKNGVPGQQYFVDHPDASGPRFERVANFD